MTSIALTGTNHTEDQLSHLRVEKLGQFVQTWYGEGAQEAPSSEVAQKESAMRQYEHTKKNVEDFAGLLGRACPAGVYEYVDVDVSCATKCSCGGYSLL
jgi:electron-transferring-flavoprotein dehydrogenase